MEGERYFQKGFGLKKFISEMLRESYHSSLVEKLRAQDYRLAAGDITIHLAEEFGFCYGVERAVEYAYETVKKFPDRQIYLTGEIIHNPHVNRKLRELGIRFMTGEYSDHIAISEIAPEDVVIVPAFGVAERELQALKQRGCIVVDTTCGSVLNVWKNVERYAREGLTSVIHGKYDHEETRATCSRALAHGAHYLVVRDVNEARYVCRYISDGGDKDDFMARFDKAISPGFDPDRDLERIGLANQTTMLSSESLSIAEMLKQAMAARYGEEELAARFRSFDTICSATQDRQDAVLKLVESRQLDLMIIIGGYNSSNTNNLAKIASKYTRAYHIQDPACIVSADEIRHKPIGSKEEVVSRGWLPDGPVEIGITAGASTPNNKIGEAIEKILACRGLEVQL